MHHRCGTFCGILLASIYLSHRAKSLTHDLPGYLALGAAHLLLIAASMWGTPAQLEGAMMLMYTIRAITWALCGLGLISCEWPGPAWVHLHLMIVDAPWLAICRLLRTHP
jgi:hypothetical protein